MATLKSYNPHQNVAYKYNHQKSKYTSGHTRLQKVSYR